MYRSDRPLLKEALRGKAKGRYRRLPGPLLAGILAIIVVAMYLGFSGMGMPDRSMHGATGSQNDMLAATFPMCGVGRRITCVVDGDTFWLDGVKIRIADIDAPELSPPRCEAERIKGKAAKSRLQQLLNAGAFSLVRGYREEDRYGRKLRTVTRSGRSIGETLAEEGLARRWDGSRHPWCN